MLLNERTTADHLQPGSIHWQKIDWWWHQLHSNENKASMARHRTGIHLLVSDRQKKKAKSVLYMYALGTAEEDEDCYRTAIELVDTFRKREPRVLLLLVAWKRLAESSARDESLPVSCKNGHDMFVYISERRHAWKQYKVSILASGQLNMIDQFVLLFLSERNY